MLARKASALKDAATVKIGQGDLEDRHIHAQVLAAIDSATSYARKANNLQYSEYLQGVKGGWKVRLNRSWRKKVKERKKP